MAVGTGAAAAAWIGTAVAVAGAGLQYQSSDYARRQAIQDKNDLVAQETQAKRGLELDKQKNLYEKSQIALSARQKAIRGQSLFNKSSKDNTTLGLPSTGLASKLGATTMTGATKLGFQ